MSTQGCINRYPKWSVFTPVGTRSLPSSDDDKDLLLLSRCSSTGNLGFRGHFSFLGSSLTCIPSAHSLSHSTLHSCTACSCFLTMSFHSASRAALAAFQSSCVTCLCSNSVASLPLLSFWPHTSPMDSSLVRCLPSQVSPIAFGKQNGTITLLLVLTSV